MQYSVVISQPAKKDIRDIISFIKKDKIGAAQKLKKTFLDKIESLRLFPLRGKKVKDKFYSGSANDREILIGEYLLVYRIKAKMVQIIRILHGRMDLKKISLQ